MKDILIAQVKLNLRTFKNTNYRIKQALDQVEKLEKNAQDINDIINSPFYQNIVHILGPYAVYYKIDQVLKLLKELGAEAGKPKSPYYIVPQPGK